MYFKKIGMAITVDLNGGYSVRANILMASKENHTYEVRFEIGTSDNDDWHGTDSSVFMITSENINMDVTKRIKELHKDHYFDAFIKRIETENKAFEIGFEALESVAAND